MALGERIDKSEDKPSSVAFTLLGTAMLWVKYHFNIIIDL
jgi:ammonia channel protein AmtB